jgi:tetratricopeptide (TPR) repeat protein
MKTIFFRLCLLATVVILDIGRAYAYDPKALKKAIQSKDAQQLVNLLSPEIEKLNPKDLVLLAKAYSDTKNSEAAIKTYTAALSKNPKDFTSKTAIASEQFSIGKDSLAIVTAREALELNDKYLPAYNVLIKIYEKRENKYELRLLYEDMLQKKLNSVNYIAQLCELTTLDRLYDLALKYCQNGISKDPENPVSYVYLGLTYRDTEEPKKAEMLLRRAAIRFPQSLLAQITYAIYLEEKKSFVEAYNYFKRATLADSKSEEAFVGLGKAALEIQKYQESLDAFKAACLLDKRTLPAIRRATNTLRTMKIESWIKAFDQASERCGIRLEDPD